MCSLFLKSDMCLNVRAQIPWVACFDRKTYLKSPSINARKPALVTVEGDSCLQPSLCMRSTSLIRWKSKEAENRTFWADHIATVVDYFVIRCEIIWYRLCLSYAFYPLVSCCEIVISSDLISFFTRFALTRITLHLTTTRADEEHVDLVHNDGTRNPRCGRDRLWLHFSRCLSDRFFTFSTHVYASQKRHLGAILLDTRILKYRHLSTRLSYYIQRPWVIHTITAHLSLDIMRFKRPKD